MATDEDYFRIVMVGTPLSALTMLSLLVYHVGKSRKSKHASSSSSPPSPKHAAARAGGRTRSQSSADRPSRWNQAIKFFTYSTIVAFIVSMLLIFTRDVQFAVENRLSCHLTVQLSGAAYIFAKGNLWCLFVVRLTVFQNSSFKYSIRKVIIPLLVYIVGVVLVSVTLGMIFSESNVTDDGRCAWGYPTWTVILMILSDMLMTILCMLLFVRPLLKVSQSKRVGSVRSGQEPRAPESPKKMTSVSVSPETSPAASPVTSPATPTSHPATPKSPPETPHKTHETPKLHETHSHDAAFLFVVRKYVVLVSVSLTTTFAALVWVAQDASDPINATVAVVCFEVDNVINVICVLLMSSIHNEMYKKLCCCCQKMFRKQEQSDRLHALEQKLRNPSVGSAGSAGSITHT